MENLSAEHAPVLLHEVIQYLDPKPGDFMIDGTVDGGGHAAAVMEKIMPQGAFLGVDWDRDMVARAEPRRTHGARERYAHGNYADLPEILAREGLGKADGLLLDLGFSSTQLARSGRGFSFGENAADEPLLMTYDDAREPVAKILRELHERDLASIIHEFGDERFAGKIARAIVSAEKRKRITTSGELAAVVRDALPKGYERGRIDPATRTFQALRIYANDELGNLKKVLEALPRILKPGGRVVVLSFHSQEDGIVKRAFRTAEKEAALEILTPKPVEASRGEVGENPRSRSAKLRAAVAR